MPRDMCALYRYAVIDLQGNEVFSADFDTQDEAVKAADTDQAVVEREYAYVDEELVWTPDGSTVWPPEGERNPFRVNEYLTNRACGGPEEGGWWYDTGQFIECHGRFATRAEAEAEVEARKAWLADKRDGQYTPSSVLCDGWTVLLIEDCAGADYPAERPNYE